MRSSFRLPYTIICREIDITRDTFEGTSDRPRHRLKKRGEISCRDALKAALISDEGTLLGGFRFALASKATAAFLKPIGTLKSPYAWERGRPRVIGVGVNFLPGSLNISFMHAGKCPMQALVYQGYLV